MSSLEAKVVVHFGPKLEHYVRVPLHNKVRPFPALSLSASVGSVCALLAWGRAGCVVSNGDRSST